MSGFDLRTSVILMVDDERGNLDLLESCLADEGYLNLVATRDSRELMALYEKHHPDLILLDLHMPHLDGFEVMELLRQRLDPQDYLPILVLTADITRDTRQRALSSGASDFLTKPLDVMEVTLRIRNLLQTRFLHCRQRAALRAAEEARRRALFLADATEVLASSFDYHTTLSLLCRAAVPRIADFCAVDVLADEGAISRVGLAHVDPAKEPLLREVSRLRPGALPADHPVIAALVEGRSTLATEITNDMWAAVVVDDDHRRIVETLDPRSLVTVPLRAAGAVRGALTLAHSESGRHFEPADLELAQELARRAALTIDNARLYNDAQHATRARDEMLAVVAHDLRNPLSTVSMGSEMLREGATTDLQRRHAEMVGRAAERMRRLIEDLLEVTRIESGKLRVDARPERVQPLVREAATLLGPIARSQEIALEVELPDELPLALMDGARVMQVLSNLVGNALKFTPAGGAVRVSCRAQEGGLLFAVSDTGPGIRPEQIPHIFGRFWQASDQDRRGIGLGLSIVRGIVDAHGGRVWVESEVGKGSTFYFVIPQASAETSPAAHPGSADPSAETLVGPSA